VGGGVWQKNLQILDLQRLASLKHTKYFLWSGLRLPCLATDVSNAREEHHKWEPKIIEGAFFWGDLDQDQ